MWDRILKSLFVLLSAYEKSGEESYVPFKKMGGVGVVAQVLNLC